MNRDASIAYHRPANVTAVGSGEGGRSNVRRRNDSVTRSAAPLSDQPSWHDLLLLDADPLSDIRNTRRIDTVVIRGRVISKSEIAKMLAARRRAGRR